MKNHGKAAAILLGIVVVLAFAGFAVAVLSMRPAKLSQQKMQKRAEAWKDVKTTETVKEPEDDYQEEEYETELESFEAAGTAGKAVRKEDKEDAKEKEADTEYLCSYSSERILTEEDITSLNDGTYQGLPNGKGIIQMVINEIYARHGYQFETPEVQQYFEQKEWYQDIRTRNADMDAVLRGMSQIERSNVEFLSAHNG